MTAANIIPLADHRKAARSGGCTRAESFLRHERRSSPTHASPPAFAGDVEAAADLLLAMERHPLAETVVWVVRGAADRRARVAVRVGTRLASALLDPRDARFTADILIDEQAFPGCVGVADRLNDAANEAEALNGLPRRRSRRRGSIFRSSHATMVAFAVILAVLFGAAVADTAMRWVGPEAAAAADAGFIDVAIGD